MAAQWQYESVKVVLVNNQTGMVKGLQWRTQIGGQQKPLYSALSEYGSNGWELVSLYPTVFEHSGRDADNRGYKLLDYPYKNTRATEMLAVFKRPRPS